MTDVNVEYGQHAVLLGVPGSGKTFLARNLLLPPAERVLVVDTEEYDFEDFPKVRLKTALRLAKGNSRFVCRVVMSGDFPQNLGPLDELCSGLLKNGHDLYVYFDEITDFADASVIPPSLRALMRKGRKRSITVIAGTQRPQLLNKTVFSNSVHRFVFFISDYDAARIREFAPWVEDHLAEIPWKSYRCIYQGPDSTLTILEPAEEYAWRNRFKR